MDKVEYYNKEVRDCVGSTTKVTTNQPTLINLLRALESSYAEVISSFASPIFLTANSYDNSYDETGEDLEDWGLLKEDNKEKRAYYEKALGKSFCNWWANPGNVNEEEGGDKTKTFWIRLESRDMPPLLFLENLFENFNGGGFTTSIRSEWFGGEGSCGWWENGNSFETQLELEWIPENVYNHHQTIKEDEVFDKAMVNFQFGEDQFFDWLQKFWS